MENLNPITRELILNRIIDLTEEIESNTLYILRTGVNEKMNEEFVPMRILENDILRGNLNRLRRVLISDKFEEIN